MLRTTTLTTAALLGLALLTPTTAANAAGETCRGLPATMVGSPLAKLVGTDGPDVVVTNGAEDVRTLGGDDVVCVTTHRATVWTGPGDDVVDSTTMTKLGAQTYLGAGSDHFYGGPGFDVVYAGDQVDYQHVDADRDVIDGGPAGSGYGDDSVHTGQAGLPNADVVHIASGGVSYAGVPAAGGELDGGGEGSLGLTLGATDEVSIDNRAHTVTFGDRPVLPFTGFTGFSVLAQEGPRSFDFTGSGRDEKLYLEMWKPTTQSVRMGGGDDELTFYSYGRRAAAGSTYNGGRGHDELELTLPDEVDLDLDLGRGRLDLGPRRNEVRVPTKGFEDATLMAEDIEVRGTNGRNVVYTYACRARVEGRGGKDKLKTFDTVMDEGLRCKGMRAKLFGGPGRDVLVGTRGRDRLIGGPGRDRADGSSGRDVCSAEKVRRCEVRRR